MPAALIFDHVGRRGWALAEEGQDALIERLHRALESTRIPPAMPEADASAPLAALKLEEEDPGRFAACVGAALEHIRAGDIYQANLSRASQREAPAPRPH